MSADYFNGDLGGGPKTPLLATIYTVAGWVVVAGTCIVAAFVPSGPFGSAAFPSVLMILCTGGLSTLGLIGLAEMLGVVARIEYNTREGKDDAVNQ